MRNVHVQLIIIFLINTTLLGIYILPASSLISYETKGNFFIGEWNVVGSDLNHLSFPNHIFASDSSIIISDTNNSRIVIVDKQDWNHKSTIDTFSYEGALYEIGKIYQTVLDINGNYYSIMNNATIIKFDTYGNISLIIHLPVWELNSDDQINIAIDRTISPNVVITSFIWVERDITHGGPQVFTLSDIIQEDPQPIANIYGMSLQFSYNQKGSPEILSKNEVANPVVLNILQFGLNSSNSYTVLYEFQLSNQNVPDFQKLFPFATYGYTFLNFSKGFLFSGGRFTDGNIVFTKNLEYADDFNELAGFGELSVRGSLFDLELDLVIICVPKENVIIGLTFNSVIKALDISNTSDDIKSSPWYARFLTGSDYDILYLISGVIVLASLIVVFRRIIKKKHEGQDSSS